MHIEDGLLMADDGKLVPFMASPNHGDGLLPLYLVVHYSASPFLETTVGACLRGNSRTSAHLIIGRDGETVQTVPLHRRAWHAGRSRWGPLDDMNRYSIGLELVNAGALSRDAAGRWIDWAGHVIPDHDVVIASHKHNNVVCGWHRFTVSQIDRTMEVAHALNARFKFRDVLGHDDIAPGRKIDPGPAFPMALLRTRLLG